ncbi:MAG TPA: SEFIR domain-containing protein, partial [Pseudonocardiaceae bacterium]|nr:SEFIR domain-containing protein [Pseudonocardiaceae bacterium]
MFVSYASDSGEHTDAVLGFAERLRGELGIDVRLDLWERDRRRDWVAWVVDQIEHGDFVLAIGSPQYKRLAASEGESHDHARFQLAMLREHLAADRPQLDSVGDLGSTAQSMISSMISPVQGRCSYRGARCLSVPVPASTSRL